MNKIKVLKMFIPIIGIHYVLEAISNCDIRPVDILWTITGLYHAIVIPNILAGFIYLCHVLGY